eukprot:5081887-Prymnesium_polylepis.4
MTSTASTFCAFAAIEYWSRSRTASTFACSWRTRASGTALSRSRTLEEFAPNPRFTIAACNGTVMVQSR